MPWIIALILIIIACTAGIWASIGVAVLGWIILALFANS